jgi:hypothetical protein
MAAPSANDALAEMSRAVFNDETMKARLSSGVYTRFKEALVTGAPTNEEDQKVIAEAVFKWAREKGAVSFAHWFFPMRGGSGGYGSACGACKFDTMIDLDWASSEATKPFLATALRKGKTVALYPGGAAESGMSRPGRYVAYCRKHKGFLRLALEEHIDLLPVYTFGEESVLPQPSSVFGPIAFLQRFLTEATGLRIPPAFGGLPSAPPLTTVIGLPISLKDLWSAEIGEPVAEASVDIALKRYIDSQQKLFDQNKALVPGNHKDARLEVM